MIELPNVDGNPRRPRVLCPAAQLAPDRHHGHRGLRPGWVRLSFPAPNGLDRNPSSVILSAGPNTLCAEVGGGLTGRSRRIVGGFEPPLLQQRSDTPCPMLTSSSCFSQGRSATRSPRCCATERAPYWPKRSRPRWRNSSPSMSI